MAPPLVTVAFPCYQQQRYVAQALQSVLAQTYSPLEIVVSDDASTDGTYQIACETVAAYRGPHAVRMNQNERRLGIENYNTLMELATGDFVVMAHSDDVALPQRVERLVEAWRRHGVSLVSSNAVEISTSGHDRGLLFEQERQFDLTPRGLAIAGRSPAAHGATLAWDRAVFNSFGHLDQRSAGVCSDYILPFRASLLRGVHCVPAPLVRRRVHVEGRWDKFIGHNVHDAAELDESKLANRLAQFIYMLRTLRSFRSSPEMIDQRREELDEVEALLLKSIVDTSTRWSSARHELIAAGKHVRWQHAKVPHRAKRLLRGLLGRLRRYGAAVRRRVFFRDSP